jgi:hypothetical protein
MRDGPPTVRSARFRLCSQGAQVPEEFPGIEEIILPQVLHLSNLPRRSMSKR